MNGASGLMQLVTAREKKGGKNNFIAPRLLLIITPHDDDDGRWRDGYITAEETLLAQ